MQMDIKMTDKPRGDDGNMRAQSSTLNEELGLVDYLFTDKTGLVIEI